MKKILALSITSILLLSACGGEPQDGQYAELAQCLTEKDVKMYGAFWCPHCESQKKLFGDDFRYITYVECDPRGENGDREACLKAGVERYPTWIFPGQEPIIGEQEPAALAKKANCEAPSGETSATESPTEEVSSDESSSTTESSSSEESSSEEPAEKSSEE